MLSSQGAYWTYLKAIRVYLMVRTLIQLVNRETETKLPLTNEADVVKVDECLNLSKIDISVSWLQTN